MYVCICRGVTEKQLRQFAKECQGSVEKVTSVSGVGCDCGCCREYACQFLQEFREEEGIIEPAA